ENGSLIEPSFSERGAPLLQALELCFLLGDAPRHQLVVRGAGVGGSPLDQLAKIAAHDRNARVELLDAFGSGAHPMYFFTTSASRACASAGSWPNSRRARRWRRRSQHWSRSVCTCARRCDS